MEGSPLAQVHTAAHFKPVSLLVCVRVRVRVCVCVCVCVSRNRDHEMMFPTCSIPPGCLRPPFPPVGVAGLSWPVRPHLATLRNSGRGSPDGQSPGDLGHAEAQS